MAISACEKSWQWREALHLIFHEMPRAKIAPDVIVYTSAISACASAGEWTVALRLFEQMPMKPDVVACNALLSAFERTAQWENALNFLENIPSYGLQPTLRSINTALSACGKSGTWEQAVKLFYKLKTVFSPDLVSYHSIIEALPENMALAIRFYREATEKRLFTHWVDENVVDFHNCPLSFAKCAVWVILEDFARGHPLNKPLIFICGKGLHSKESQVLMPELQRMLSELDPPLEWRLLEHNSGRLVVQVESIRAWIERSGTRK